MRFVPTNYGVFDDFFDDFFKSPMLRHRDLSMKTNIVEKDNQYLLNIEMPGFNKEDINIDLKDGYLTIKGISNQEKQEKDQSGKIIRQERHTGSLSRSFYIGEQYTGEDIKAKYEKGELVLELPKKEETKNIENTRIMIE